MTSQYNELSGQSVERLRTLADGVFAVAMTLLVLDVRLPEVEAGSNPRSGTSSPAGPAGSRRTCSASRCSAPSGSPSTPSSSAATARTGPWRGRR